MEPINSKPNYLMILVILSVLLISAGTWWLVYKGAKAIHSYWHQKEEPNEVLSLEELGPDISHCNGLSGELFVNCVVRRGESK